MGGGSKGKTSSSKSLERIAEAFFAETTPARQELIGQMEEALTTGGVGARMPIISKAEESSRQATSNALRALETQLATTGQAGTPFGTRARAETTQRGEQATAGIGPNIIAQFLQQIPGFITGSNQMTIQGLTGAAGAQAQMAGSEANWLQALMGPFTAYMGA